MFNMQNGPLEGYVCQPRMPPIDRVLCLQAKCKVLHVQQPRNSEKRPRPRRDPADGRRAFKKLFPSFLGPPVL